MFTTTRRVEFADTDMAGIMHFSNFFRFMEVAETAFLRERGLSVTWPDGDTRYGFPRVSASCDYTRPVRFGDELTIGVTVEKVGTKSVSYRYDFSLAGQPVATGRMTAVYCRAVHPHGIDPLPIPPDLRAKLEADA